ncbi:hypothetical protein [Microseira sp. BLCC-F43]
MSTIFGTLSSSITNGHIYTGNETIASNDTYCSYLLENALIAMEVP